MLRLSLVVASLLAPPNASASPAARPSVDSVFTSLRTVREFHDASISPDGRRAAWSQKLPDAEGRERLGAISIAELPSGAPRRLSAAADGKPRRELEADCHPNSS